MPEYEEHPSKASSWGDGQFVVLPEAEATDSTVWFGAKVDAGGETLWEGLLARGTAKDRARICAVPFWLNDVNLEDEVSLIESGEDAVANAIVKDAGNFTFRVIFERADSDDDRWRELMVQLEPYDCWFDVRSPGFVALSAPPDHAQSVADFLSTREQDGELQYEAGRSRVPGEP